MLACSLQSNLKLMEGIVTPSVFRGSKSWLVKATEKMREMLDMKRLRELPGVT